MADIDLKISILKKSMSTFSGWLDQCEELINALPTQLEQCDHAHLRELAMKYKVSVKYIFEFLSWGMEVVLDPSIIKFILAQIYYILVA